ncbi:MAG: hypothetical protein A3I75_07765 [Deltaproteobacteria bacterium RIFCSPLOWO2_02_FULL_50_16]|nr:MAG: hypothetical protein A3B79_00015 [Deltaproteobacteria bacterium RIFCSPHIGHO2_02_FULL_50_15]OGQ57431.1 MAG: hypothetical protein A3I75_07765 [Deltaproteobacteria bacterium RIFCSPLOWO2_02_FULL_50_16]OGQ67706.1 MAG: hypothetical protein A3F89_03740 [Deltaproteobacteria bacterium RIFCSPLOWO2_12_FULL_50_11]
MRRWELVYIIGLWVLIVGAILYKISGDGTWKGKIAKEEKPVPAASASLSLPPPSEAPEKVTIEINSPKLGWLRVRENPNLQAKEVAVAQHGEQLVSLQEEKGWYQIDLGLGKKGWVLGSYIIPLKKEKSSPAVQKIAQIHSPDTGWLRVREQPAVDSKELGKVRHGRTFVILKEQKGWHQIEFQGHKGWVLGKYLVPATTP